MQRTGQKQMVTELAEPVPVVPEALASYGLEIAEGALVYSYDRQAERTGIRR